MARTRSIAIFTDNHNLVGLATAFGFGLCFLFGVLREPMGTTSVAETITKFTGSVTVMTALPAWFYMLGQGLGGVDSIATMNKRGMSSGLLDGGAAGGGGGGSIFSEPEL